MLKLSNIKNKCGRFVQFFSLPHTGFFLTYSVFFSSYVCIIIKDLNKAITCQNSLPFESEIDGDYHNIFTISGFSEVESFRLFRFQVVISSFLVVLKEADSNTCQFLSIFSQEAPRYKKLFTALLVLKLFQLICQFLCVRAEAVYYD